MWVYTDSEKGIAIHVENHDDGVWNTHIYCFINFYFYFYKWMWVVKVTCSTGWDERMEVKCREDKASSRSFHILDSRPFFTASRTSAEEYDPPVLFITIPMMRLAAFSFFL